MIRTCPYQTNEVTREKTKQHAWYARDYRVGINGDTFSYQFVTIIPSEYCLLRGYFLCFDNAVTYYRDPQNDNVCDSVLRAAYELLFVFLPGVFYKLMTMPEEYHLI